MKVYLLAKSEVMSVKAFKSYSFNRTDRQTDRCDLKNYQAALVSSNNTQRQTHEILLYCD